MQKIFSFTRATFFYSLASFLPAGVNLIFLPVFATKLSPNDFGIYESYVVISTLIIALSYLGMPGAMMRLIVGKDQIEKNILINSSLRVILISSSLFCLLTYILLVNFDIFFAEISNYSFYLILILSGVFFKGYFEIFRKLQQINERPFKLSVAILFIFLINLTSKLFLVFIYGLKFEALVISEFFSNFISAVIARTLLNKHLNDGISKKVQKDCLEYGIPVSFHHFGTWLSLCSFSCALLVLRARDVGDSIYSTQDHTACFNVN